VESTHYATLDRDPEQYKPIIQRMAYKYASSILPRDPSLTFDDLIGDGWVWFMELIQQEQDKGGFSHPFEAMLTTWLEGWFLVKYESLTTQKRTRPKDIVDAEIVPSFFNWNKVEQVIDLKEETKNILKTLFQAPKELWDDLIPSNGRLKLDQLDKYIKKVERWRWSCLLGQLAKLLSENPVITKEGETRMACCICEEEVKGALKGSIHICSNCTMEMMNKSPQEVSNIIEDMDTIEKAEFISKCFLSQPKGRLVRRTPFPPTGILRRREKNIKNKLDRRTP